MERRGESHLLNRREREREENIQLLLRFGSLLLNRLDMPRLNNDSR